jgi:glycosyltransferase involved in cell wall biosynthesis
LLQREIRQINPRCEIFENAIDEDDPQFRIQPHIHSDVRFGWIGGHCHLPDIKLLEDAPPQIKGHFSMHLFGHDGVKGGVYDAFSDILSGGGRLIKSGQFWLYNQAPAREYTQFYNHIDVSLVPLVNNKFNSMKSELKIIEAGFMRKAVICSDVMPYSPLLNEKNSLRCTQKSHWAKRMQKLINNRSMIPELAHNLYETIKYKYDLGNVTRRREQYYETLIK